MAIRLADTARPNNFIEGEQRGTFPVAYAEDIWFADGTRLSEKTFGGDSIQKEELPLAGATEEGNVYQYIGASGTYEHGCFYECVEANGVYSWKDLQVIKNPVIYTNTSPVIGAYKKDSVIIYSGEDTYGFKKGHHYKYVINESHALYLFTGEYTITHETIHLRLLESAIVEDAHVYDAIGECIGYVVSVSGRRISYYSISDADIFEIAIYGSSSTPDTFSITDYIDIGGSGESSTLYADNPIGSIIPYGGANAPTGWFLCDGQAISRSDYADLFNAIGTAFGSGDGSTTFNLPDLRNRAVMGAGTNGALGESQNDTTAKNGLSGATSSAGSHRHSVLAYTGAKATIANIYPRTVIGSNMEAYTGSYVENADYGGTSRPYVEAAGDHTHPVSISSSDSETRPKNVRINFIIKAQHTSIPADFMDAVDDVLSEFAKPISLVPLNNSSITYDKSRIIGGIVTVCASITVPSGNYIVKENAVANVPSLGTSSIGYILPCLYRNIGSGVEEPGYAIIQTDGNLYPYYTKTEYNEIRINASYSSKV